MRLHVSVALGAFPALCSAGDGWDDFANNLATDLAPILQLFGEQATKQFLSESTGILDNIILAMAPLGILTAVVSVIRVCGGPRLRAFIGRAQEGAGVAETELCSSTGRDVCEMYQNGAITRVFGRPKLLEIVHDPQNETLYQTSGPESETCGIYTFPEYQKSSQGRKEWKVKRKGDWEGGPTQDDSKLEEVVKHETSDEFAPNPNLLLNIGFRKPPEWMLQGAAVFGVLLQSAVLAFAVVVTKHLRLKKDNKIPPPWAMELTIMGTVLLCCGMLACSFLIEKSTMERTFERRNLKSRASTIFWVQPGGQIIGDQSFDAFAHSDSKSALREYVSSWRKPVTRLDSRLTGIAVFITMTGFVLQFVGLRGMHSTVSVFQLGAVLVMSIIRAALRTQRLEGKDNHILRHSSAARIQGHELDWLAFELDQLTFQRSHPHKGARALVSCNTEPNTASKLWRYRIRLGRLTSLARPHSSPQQSWEDRMVKGRPTAIALARAISAMANRILSQIQNCPNLADSNTLYFGFQCVSGPESHAGNIYFTLKREVDTDGARTENWIADVAQLEAAITLWTWSMKTQHLKKQHEDVIVRVVCAKTKLEENDSPAEIQLWAGTQKLDIVKSILNLGPVRFFGWNTVPYDFHNTDLKRMTVFSSVVKGTLLELCAQDIFAGFLKSLLSLGERILRDFSLVRSGSKQRIKNRTVNDLIDIFVSSNLGSREDAILCIIPVVVSSEYDSPTLDVISQKIRSGTEKLSRKISPRQKMTSSGQVPPQNNAENQNNFANASFGSEVCIDTP
ncbi:hypothetical protein K469DRAFT_590132 [Zopfia rhizophila CBS 207.26]|uniref:Uncharacterized protein n=1 Tax=Zopfia rhizophila CBS 207.26 TaxID=1314779 RepID=A0A6A6DPZ6_9PEZI|nr:hypothetical protein K469DRAFT_590132 [Zopfia rhizophila CBS 207.26]